MKAIIEFFKICALGGFLVLLPLVLLYLVLSETLGLIVVLATPIASLFPQEIFKDIQSPLLMAIVLLTGASFLIGLAMRSGISKHFGAWIEEKTLNRLAIYGMLKRLSHSIIQIKDEDAFQTGLMDLPGGNKVFVYIIEDHGNDQLTVLLPSSPTSTMGTLQITTRDKVRILKANLGQVSRSLSHWGMGAKDLIEPQKD